MFYFQNLNIFNLKMSKLITIRNKNILGVTKGHIFCFIYKYLNAEEFRSISVSVRLATSCYPMWSKGAFDPPSICPSVCLWFSRFFELNQNSHNSTNLQAMISRFCMIVDLYNTYI